MPAVEYRQQLPAVAWFIDHNLGHGVEGKGKLLCAVTAFGMGSDGAYFVQTSPRRAARKSSNTIMVLFRLPTIGVATVHQIDGGGFPDVWAIAEDPEHRRLSPGDFFRDLEADQVMQCVDIRDGIVLVSALQGEDASPSEEWSIHTAYVKQQKAEIEEARAEALAKEAALPTRRIVLPRESGQ